MKNLKKLHPSLVIIIAFLLIVGFHSWDPFGWNVKETKEEIKTENLEVNNTQEK